MNAAGKILIVEDEIKLAQLLADYLAQSAFSTQQLHRGDEVVDWLNNNDCDLILLDLMLPGLDGLEVCKAVRAFSNIPIIMVTARIEEIDRLIGLEVGADDYVCKPFSPREVVARVKAVMRRFSHSQQGTQSPLRLQESTFKILFSDQSCELTKVEFYLLKTLFDSAGRIYSRDQLMDLIYTDRHIVNDRTIDSHVKNIRKKLIQLGVTEQAIHSVYGVGYKFE